MSSEAKAPPPAPAAAERGRRNSLENILVEDAQVLMSFLQTPGEEDDDTEIEELLKAEKAVVQILDYLATMLKTKQLVTLMFQVERQASH